MFRTIAALLLVLLVAEAAQAERKVVGANRNGVVSYDPAEVKPQGRGVLLVWVRNEMPPERIEELARENELLKDVAYNRELMSMDCVKRRFRPLFRVYYGRDDRSLVQSDLSVGYAPLAKDMIMHTIATEICGGVAGGRE